MSDTVLLSGREVNVTLTSGASEVHALRDVNINIADGERVALTGPSGSGKTTLLHVLGGLIVPSSGEVRWRGRPLSSLDSLARSRARASGIAFVFQSPNLLATLTAYENVAFAATVRSHEEGEGLPETNAGPDARELLALVGLADKAHSLPAELSGGEAQRVALARALAGRPRLLLCDEPTGHLDSDTSRRVLDLIDALQQRFGFALVTATHDRSVARRYRRTILLEFGQTVDRQWQGASAAS